MRNPVNSILKNILLILIIGLILVGCYFLYSILWKKDKPVITNANNDIQITNTQITVGDTLHKYVPPEGKVTIRKKKENVIKADSLLNEIKNIIQDSSKTKKDKETNISQIMNSYDTLINSFEIIIKDKGFTFKPFVGLGYSGKINIIGGAKFIYYKRYGFGLYASNESFGPEVSRHIDDIIKFHNTEVSVGSGFRYKGGYSIYGGLINTF